MTFPSFFINVLKKKLTPLGFTPVELQVLKARTSVIGANTVNQGCSYIYMVIVKNPWVHGLNKSRIPSHNGGTI